MEGQRLSEVEQSIASTLIRSLPVTIDTIEAKSGFTGKSVQSSRFSKIGTKVYLVTKPES